MNISANLINFMNQNNMNKPKICKKPYYFFN